MLAVGFGTVLARVIEPYTVWILIAVGVANLWRLVRPSGHHAMQRRLPQFVRASPLMLGVLFGMGFETASQLTALLLAGKLNPWVLGVVFSGGMMLVDGADGFLAARTQRLALAGNVRATLSTRLLGVIVVVSSFGLATVEFCGYDLNRFALPLGAVLFTMLIGLRVWSSVPKEMVTK
jgi:high-affinity nickel-transport protein